MLNYQGLLKSIIETRTELTTEKQDAWLPLWQAWYTGYYKPFHNYYVFNGEHQVWMTKKTLRMAKKVCEDWASLLMSDKIDVVIEGDSNKNNLKTLLKDLKFKSKASKAVEVGFALSFSALVVDLKNITFDENSNVVLNNKSQIKLSYYKAGQAIPITFDNGDITECAFISENKKKLEVNAHILIDGEYHIIIYRKNKENNQEVEYDINTKSPTPLFSIIYPNIENNLYPNSNYPISVFGNAIDVLKSIDNKYDCFDNEFVLGKKRMFVSSEMTAMVYSKDKDGNTVAETQDVFDPNDTSVYRIPQGQDGKTLFYSPNDPLRVESIVAGINADLKILANKVGLGNDYYTFEKGTVVTATQVISEKSDTYRNIKLHQQVLRPALENIVKAIIYCNNVFTLNEKLPQDAIPQIIFDDSIIEDKTTEKASDRIDLTNGVMSKVEYRMKWYGEDKKTAEENIYAINGREDLIARLTKYMPFLESNLMTAKMFVKLAYTKEDLTYCGISEEELIKFIEEQKQTSSLSDFVGIGGYIPTKNNEDENEETEIDKDNEQ